ncbi:YjiK family protein [Escherichia coli]|nr:YjiK family protein [Escherichia coli]
MLSAAFIALVCIFLQEDINNISRLLEKYKDTPSSLNLSAYSVVIQAKPVDGIKENLSGLTWSAKHGMLFAVINNPPEIVWITTEGKLTGKISLPDIKDPEAIAWAGEDTFWIGSEKENTAWLLSVDITNKSYKPITKITFDDYNHPRNNGLEGLTWDNVERELFAAKEKTPLIISKAKNIREKLTINTLKLSAVNFIKDISGLHYYTPSSSLLLLSDESKKVLELNTNNVEKITDRLFLYAGWSGLTEDIPQAEGITIDDYDNLYIVSEPNLFYRFEKIKNPAL